MDQAAVVAAVQKTMEGIKSQEMLFALCVLMLSAVMMGIGGKWVCQLIAKRDESIKELVSEVKNQNVTITKVAELQNVDLSTTSRNRDLLQEIKESQVRMSTCLEVLKSDVSSHIVECRQKGAKP
jgi:2C-methyl-D-erythritol 2,4-cyclodiphosphate synthase